MLKAFLHNIGVALSNYLMQEVESAPLTTATDIAELRACLAMSFRSKDLAGLVQVSTGPDLVAGHIVRWSNQGLSGS